MRPFTFGEFLASRLGLLPLPVYDAFHAALMGRSVTVAAELRLFDALDAGPLSADALAAALELPAEPAGLLLGALEAAGYLERSRAGYALSPMSRRWLAPSSPENLLGFLRYVGLLQRKWSDLGETLRNGRPRRPYAEAFSAEEWRIYVLGMRDLSRLLLPPLLNIVALPAGATRLLDVGGSHGAYTAAFCERHPRLHGVIVDLPPALEVTRELVEQSPAGGRIRLAGVDITRDAIPGSGYDVVLLINMVHGFSEEGNAGIFTKLSGALAPGGRLYVLDQFLDPRARGTRRLLPFLVGLNLLNEAGGTAYDRGAVERWCRKSGLRIVRSRRFRLPGVEVLVAAKEGSTAA